jgi:hypothetical protein
MHGRARDRNRGGLDVPGAHEADAATKLPRCLPDARRVAPTQGVARSPLQRRLQHHQLGCVHVLHADDRSGDRYAGGGVQVRLCEAGFDGLSERRNGSSRKPSENPDSRLPRHDRVCQSRPPQDAAGRPARRSLSPPQSARHRADADPGEQFPPPLQPQHPGDVKRREVEQAATRIADLVLEGLVAH